MSKLKNELGMSILFITHDLGLVKEFSDNVCVMKDGKIVEQGNTLRYLIILLMIIQKTIRC
jgi:microcin C transport system ATP-binding protein